MSDATVRVTQRGAITLPKALRERYGIAPGDRLRLIALDGAFVLLPHASEVEALADQLAGQLRAQGETVESLTATLRAAREQQSEQ